MASELQFEPPGAVEVAGGHYPVLAAAPFVAAAPFFAAALCLLACAGTAVPAATAADVQRAVSSRPETTLAELEQGRELYLGRCSACHQPIAPASFPAEAWPEHVGEMKARAKLTNEEEQLVLLYLTTLASRPAVGEP